MRWETPVDGDWRIKNKFAFLPIKANNEIRWLEIVKIKQRYSDNYAVSSWYNICFIDEEV